MRKWLGIAALLILPLVVYWPTITHEYGFRDDYSLLREVRERPGWLMTLTSSSGRPVYGAVLEASLYPIHQVRELAKLRALAALLAGERPGQVQPFGARAEMGIERREAQIFRGEAGLRRAGEGNGHALLQWRSLCPYALPTGQVHHLC